jgi:hypothetical protein
VGGADSEKEKKGGVSAKFPGKPACSDPEALLTLAVGTPQAVEDPKLNSGERARPGSRKSPQSDRTMNYAG